MPEKNISLKYDGEYPSFMVESDEKIDFPHKGTMKIKFTKTDSTEEDDYYTCEIQVEKIISMYPKGKKSDDGNDDDDNRGPYRRRPSAEDELDRLARDQMMSRNPSAVVVTPMDGPTYSA